MVFFDKPGQEWFMIKPIAFLGICLTTLIQAGEFSKRVLSDQYFCDGVAGGDVDKDGHPDVVAGPYCYFGPEFQTKMAIYPAVPLDPALSPSNSMFSFLFDFNRDGWLDVLVLGRVHRHQAFWYQNPGSRSDQWKKHFVFHRVKGESPTLTDFDKDGRPELLTHNEKHWGWIAPDPSDPEKPWEFHPVSERGEWPQFYHGMGVGDFNADGRTDILLNEGCYLQPADHPRSRSWEKLGYLFSSDRGGAQMFARDLDGDSDADVVTSLNAHEWGLAWFENVGSSTDPFFEKHMIMGTRSEEARYGVAFSQPHALEMGDLNQDGHDDIVVGKRRWAHGPKGDVEPGAAPVLYWFEWQRRGDGKVRFQPHLIDQESGVGVQIAVQDMNGDRRPDILTASKLGTFLFINQIAR